MKYLILSFQAGGGHHSAATAIAEQLNELGHTAVVQDYLALTDSKKSDSFNKTYIRVAKHVPWAFGMVYAIGRFYSKHIHFGHSPLFHWNIKYAEALRAYLADNCFDVIIATHFYPAMAIAHLKETGFPVPLSFALSTDYTCYPFWEEAACDYYILGHEDMIPEFLKRGIKREKMLPYGIPVRGVFNHAPTKEQAREKLGIPMDEKVILVVGGSMGAGHLRSFAWEMHRKNRDAHLVLVCGRNEHLKSDLELFFRKEDKVHVIGFTNEIHTLMKACDVLYTKPGGLTSTEAIVCGTPMVHTEPIPGCESANIKFFAERGLCLPAKNLRRQVACGARLLEDKELRERMMQAQERSAKPDTVKKIVEFVDSLTATEPQASEAVMK
jgi:processive 1,2-diacylglycerol beta-glucosyltransferase